MNSESRRDFVKKSIYLAPAIMTLAAAPAYAKNGSEKPGKPGKPDEPGKRPKPIKPPRGRP